MQNLTHPTRLAAALAIGAALSGCGRSSPPPEPVVQTTVASDQTAGQRIDAAAASASEAATKTGNKVESTARQVGDAVESGARRTGEAIGSAVDATGRAIERGGEKIQDASKP